MAGLPFTFLHASDLHLEQPLHGIAEVPDHLRELFLDAPFRAAQSVVDAAIEHRVDFVVLVGDVADWHRAGPRASIFFADQCQRLADDSIDVYWLGGEVDRPQDWPGSIELPSSMHVVTRGGPESLIYERNGESIVRLVGLDDDHHHDLRIMNDASSWNGLATIALLHGRFNATAATDTDVTYWALGGDHGRRSVMSSTTNTTLAHYCGTPQGRSFREVGSHCATLVRVDDEANIHLDAITTDCVVWHQEQIEVDDDTSSDDLEELFSIRISELMDQYADRQLCISWSVLGGPGIGRQFRGGSLAEQLTQQLRVKYGRDVPGAWTVSIECQRCAELPDGWYDDDTIRGAFLRRVRDLRENGSDPGVLEPFLTAGGSGKTCRDPFVTALMDIDDAERREQLLQEVAELGADLLSG